MLAVIMWWLLTTTQKSVISRCASENLSVPYNNLSHLCMPQSIFSTQQSALPRCLRASYPHNNLPCLWLPESILSTQSAMPRYLRASSPHNNLPCLCLPQSSISTIQQSVMPMSASEHLLHTTICGQLDRPLSMHAHPCINFHKTQATYV